jgi:hypothetical protein
MVDPRMMCRSHLLGEHNEIHMLVGALKLKRRLDRYFENNCLEIRSIRRRHSQLAKEMQKRGYRHDSPLLRFSADYLGEQQAIRVDAERSRQDLTRRCRRCRAAFQGGRADRA